MVPTCLPQVVLQRMHAQGGTHGAVALVAGRRREGLSKYLQQRHLLFMYQQHMET